MRFRGLLLALLVVAGCSSPPSPDGGGTDARPDSPAVDAQPDVAPDTSMDDAAPDVAPDVPMDMGCPMGQSMCGATCVDTQTDAMNCGACGTRCPEMQACVMGACQLPCAAPNTRCGAGAMMTCVNTQTDTMNCGACGRACPMGQTCTAGACVCPMGGTRCGGMCVDVQTDPTNCGACGAACPAGRPCVAGVCECPMGQTRCGGACVDTQSNVANCGGCGMACPSGQLCVAGMCQVGCPSPNTRCGAGAMMVCADTQTNVAHCGMCGNACPARANSTTTCAGGACGFTCAGVFGNCDMDAENGCEADLRSSTAHCGACGNACPARANATTACTTGTCGFTCSAGFGNCDGLAVNGCETDVRTNPSHCGACGRACIAGQMCTAGMCVNVPPPNDTRAGAETIPLTASAVNLMADTRMARNDTTGACGCTDGQDVFYRFTLTVPELVYADTVGATWDTSLFLQSSTGANLANTTTGGATCNDDNGLGCTTNLQSMIAARLDPGTYFLVLSGCGNGTATVRFHHLPVGNGTVSRIMPTAGTQSVTGTTMGTGAITSACCSAGPENTHWFVTCPGFAATPFLATTCNTGATFNTSIEQRSATRTVVSACNDDACGTLSTLASMIPAGTGLHAVYADACSGAGDYNLNVSFGTPTCTSPNVQCGGSCVDTRSNAMHCGRCGNACGAGATCTNGVCTSIREFRIDSLGTDGCNRIEHNFASGDDRGGIAVSSTHVFYTGDSATARFGLGNLESPAGVGRQYDAIVSDLGSGLVYTFAAGGSPIGQSGGNADQLIEIDGATGALTMRTTTLTAPIPIGNSNIGYFSGDGQVIVLTNGRAFQVALPSGLVRDLGAMTVPTHTGCESYAWWGVAESIMGVAHIAYVQNSATIARTRVPDGMTTTVTTFSTLSDMCSFTVSPRTGRWYWHHEGGSQFGGSDESIGYCNAAFTGAATGSFRVTSLSTMSCNTTDHVALTGDDRGGIAVSPSHLFYNADGNVGRWSADDLSGAAAIPGQLDGITGDIANGTVYVLLNDANAQPPGTFLSSPFTVTQLGVVDPMTGALTPARIRLSTSINLTQDAGLFAGSGRILIHGGSSNATWFEVQLPSGLVVPRRGAPVPAHQGCENYGYWGIAEYFGGSLHAVYVENSTRIVRYRVNDGTVTTVGTYMSLSDMCSITFSPARNRWYFHHEGSSQLGTGGEVAGYCAATFDRP